MIARVASPLLLLFGLAGAFHSPSLAAQANEGVILRGQVLAGNDPATDGMVVLHRVTAEESGEIDSVRVGSDGRFRLRLPRVPDHAARAEIFFASYLYGGLAYFGPAITEAAQLDSLYLIQAYDTTSVPPGGAELPVTVRNLFLETAPEGWAVTDLFQVLQAGDRTLYSPEEGVIWSYPLPAGSRAFQVGQADMAPDALRFQNGRLEVYAPLQPGERFLLIRYEVPTREFELPLPGRTDRLEIMVREPAPPAEFPPLVATTPVELEPGNVYRRYAGEGFQDSVIRAQVAPEPWKLPAEWLGVILTGLLAAAGVYGFRLRAGRAGGEPEEGGGPSRTQLLVAVARLDEEYARSGDSSPEARQRYQARREELLAALRNLT